MLLSEILNKINTVQVTGLIHDIEINGISNNSSKIESGFIFVAVKGFKTDGHKFIPEAISNGASAIVINENSELQGLQPEKQGAVVLTVKDTRESFAQISNILFNEPSSRLNLIGITGTKGKTTTAFITKFIFDFAGRKSGLLGTIANYIGDKEVPTKLTTPEADVINSLMHEMVSEGCKNCVMEVSSHSLVLHRADFLDFNTAVFTNLTSDHMDFHSDRSEYLQAKKILFKFLKKDGTAIVNIDDEAAEEIISGIDAKVIKYGLSENADFRITNVEYDFSGTSFNLINGNSEFKIKTRLIGLFNAYNSTAAFISAYAAGIDHEVVIKAIENAPQVPGRFEVINSKGKNVIVDYSHTADSLQKTLEAIHFLTEDEIPIYTVIGCGGDRDKSKRPIMGKIASEMSSKVFLTSDNPRTENPFEILNEIEKGIEKDNYLIIEDRENAIAAAIQRSDDNAVILIAGKGHENYQEINGIRNHFSDKETAEKYLGL